MSKSLLATLHAYCSLLLANAYRNYMPSAILLELESWSSNKSQWYPIHCSISIYAPRTGDYLKTLHQMHCLLLPQLCHVLHKHMYMYSISGCYLLTNAIQLKCQLPNPMQYVNEVLCTKHVRCNVFVILANTFTGVLSCDICITLLRDYS